MEKVYNWRVSENFCHQERLILILKIGRSNSEHTKKNLNFGLDTLVNDAYKQMWDNIPTYHFAINFSVLYRTILCVIVCVCSSALYSTFFIYKQKTVYFLPLFVDGITKRPILFSHNLFACDLSIGLFIGQRMDKGSTWKLVPLLLKWGEVVQKLVTMCKTSPKWLWCRHVVSYFCKNYLIHSLYNVCDL